MVVIYGYLEKNNDKIFKENAQYFQNATFVF